MAHRGRAVSPRAGRTPPAANPSRAQLALLFRWSSARSRMSPPHPPQVQRILNDIDLDGNSKIDYEEFLASTLHLNKLNREENMMAAFEYFDAGERWWGWGPPAGGSLDWRVAGVRSLFPPTPRRHRLRATPATRTLTLHHQPVFAPLDLHSVRLRVWAWPQTSRASSPGTSWCPP